MRWLARLAWESMTSSSEKHTHRDAFQCSDSHTVSIWWHGSRPDSSTRRVVLLLPGFYDDWSGSYIQHSLRVMEQHPHTVAGVFHKPFTSSQSPTACHLPSYTEPSHVLECIHAWQQSLPDASWVLIGYSAGGNLAMRVAHLAHSYGVQVSSSMCVCSPLDVHRLHHRLTYGPAWLSRLLWMVFSTKVFWKLAWMNPRKWVLHALLFLFARSYRGMIRVLHGGVWKTSNKVICESMSAHLDIAEECPSLESRVMVYALDDPIVPPPTHTIHENVKVVPVDTGGHLGFTKDQWPSLIAEVLGDPQQLDPALQGNPVNVPTRVTKTIARIDMWPAEMI